MFNIFKTKAEREAAKLEELKQRAEYLNKEYKRFFDKPLLTPGGIIFIVRHFTVKEDKLMLAFEHMNSHSGQLSYALADLFLLTEGPEKMHKRWLELVDQIQNFKQREKLGI